jgi:hypothetical protein
MEKEDVLLIAQLLTGMKDAVDKLEDAQRRKDGEKLNLAKKEIINFQKQISELL